MVIEPASLVEDASAVLPQSGASAQDSDAPLKAEPLGAECSMDDFGKIDLRVCRVIAAEEVPEAKKLLKLTIGLGGDNRRTVFAGIKGYSSPSSLSAGYSSALPTWRRGR